MAQLSIFEKQRHFSDKDLTISVGKYDTIYITFRHDSWKRFTDSDYIAIAIRDNVLVFSDPYYEIGWKFFKLKQTHGNPETYKHTRYVQISGKAWPEFLKAARNMVGSFNFDEVEKVDEEIKEILESMEEPELIAPKGFIIVHDAESPHFAHLIPIDQITGVQEEPFEQATISLNHDNICIIHHVDESFADVINLMCKASEV